MTEAIDPNAWPTKDYAEDHSAPTLMEIMGRNGDTALQARYMVLAMKQLKERRGLQLQCFQQPVINGSEIITVPAIMVHGDFQFAVYTWQGPWSEWRVSHFMRWWSLLHNCPATAQMAVILIATESSPALKAVLELTQNVSLELTPA